MCTLSCLRAFLPLFASSMWRDARAHNCAYMTRGNRPRRRVRALFARGALFHSRSVVSLAQRKHIAAPITRAKKIKKPAHTHSRLRPTRISTRRKSSLVRVRLVVVGRERAARSHGARGHTEWNGERCSRLSSRGSRVVVVAKSFATCVSLAHRWRRLARSFRT